MKKIFLIFLMLFSITYPGSAQWEEEIPIVVTNPQLTSLAVLIENYLTKTAPGSSCILNGFAYECLYKTREFIIYPKTITGEFSKYSEEVIGPSYIGVKVNLDVKDNPYEGADSIPKIINEPYWKRFINAYPLKDPSKYLWVDIAYGYQTDKELIEEIKWIIAKNLESKGLFLY